MFSWVNRFLFEGRMEAKKLERARQEKLETKTEIVQKTLLEIIFGCFYAFASVIKSIQFIIVSNKRNFQASELVWSKRISYNWHFGEKIILGMMVFPYWLFSESGSMEVGYCFVLSSKYYPRGFKIEGKNQREHKYESYKTLLIQVPFNFNTDWEPKKYTVEHCFFIFLWE